MYLIIVNKFFVEKLFLIQNHIICEDLIPPPIIYIP